MNKGIIYKIIGGDTEKDVKYCILLERNVMIGDKEYNIYVKAKRVNGDWLCNPTVNIFKSNTGFTSKLDLTLLMGKRLNFELDYSNKIITAIEESEVKNE